MGIQNEIFNLFNTPLLMYKGVPVNIFGLPVFKNYKRNSIKVALSRLEKKLYITFSGSTIKLTRSGKRYWRKRQARLQIFESNFPKDSPKNLLLIFDIPEKRKAEREWLRFQLRRFDYKMIQQSVWIGPSPLPQEFRDYLKHIKLSHCIKTFK